jgi:hypothetical protein
MDTELCINKERLSVARVAPGLNLGPGQTDSLGLSSPGAARYWRCDRLCERLLKALVGLAFGAVFGFALLGAARISGPATLSQASGVVGTFVLWPLLVCWLGLNGFLVLGDGVRRRHSLRLRTAREGGTLSVPVLVLGMIGLVVGFFLVLRVFGG